MAEMLALHNLTPSLHPWLSLSSDFPDSDAVRVKLLAQEHNIMIRPGQDPRSLDPECTLPKVHVNSH